MSETTSDDIATGAALVRLRAAAPLVHCITNYVAMQIAANAVLAAGASPAMLHAPEEAGEFAPLAGALTVNIGTLSQHWLEGMTRAAQAATADGRPWVLDPVAVGATAFRRAAGERLLALNPTVIRGNASEILALAGAGGASKGADSGDPVDAAAEAARALTARSGAVVAVTGATDLITDGTRTARIANGHPLMPTVTALGCALTAVLGGFLASNDNPFEATTSALAYYGLAGQIAAESAAGPGSFAVAFLDALAAIDAAALDRGARVSA